MTDHCFFCNAEITGDNKTEEHVFLYGLGDRLKATDIICDSCNNLLGDIIDSGFVEELKNFVNFAGIKTHEKNQNVVVKDLETQNEYLFDPRNNTYKLRHTIVKKEKQGKKVRIDGTFRDEESAKKFFKSIQKRYPNVRDGDFVIKHKLRKPTFQVELPYTNSVAALAVLKMAIEFALLCGMDSKAMTQVINVLRSVTRGLKLKVITINNPLLERLGTEMLHPFAPIPGDMTPKARVMQAKLYTEKGRLYCWISVLGLYSYQVCLSDINVVVSMKRSIYYYGNSKKFWENYFVREAE
ncbi:HNH endonuclease [Levilactobacillus enshiensis]|uniref:HNH endonuclease n=1 Tax=Levilactobacillus enshiensis TaxID=2590213 RepID=UPI00117BA0A7|nr:HNH endonuclease [Levilactobacillus enshiensis]